jgi:DNA-directed RNA polymerase subunit RPC12/RpoP
MRVDGHDQNVERQRTCSACGAKLFYLKKDVESITIRDYTGSSDGDRYIITCPDCNEKLSVKAWW